MKTPAYSGCGVHADRDGDGVEIVQDPYEGTIILGYEETRALVRELREALAICRKRRQRRP